MCVAASLSLPHRGDRSLRAHSLALGQGSALTTSTNGRKAALWRIRSLMKNAATNQQRKPQKTVGISLFTFNYRAPRPASVAPIHLEGGREEGGLCNALENGPLQASESHTRGILAHCCVIFMTVEHVESCLKCLEPDCERFFSHLDRVLINCITGRLFHPIAVSTPGSTGPRMSEEF